MPIIDEIKPWIKTRLRKTEKQWRFKTSAWRRLPDFALIGTQKGGTTSLFYYLCQHPDVKEPFRKEVHYFDRYYVHGIDWYKAFFPFVKSGDRALTGEATPEYLYFPTVPKRMVEILPEAKLVVMLRDPVDRAYSNYKFYKRRELESATTFEEALELEAERLRGEKERLISNRKYQSHALLRYSYFDRGLYAEQIKHWLEYYPREQFLFLKSEDFFERPQECIDKVCDFLRLAPFKPENMPVKNAGAYSGLDEQFTKDLRAKYQPSIDELVELLGPEFQWW